ncbi:hypothetical protein [Okeania sp. SIO2B3]|uniref:hypothetical protein n=1 Tax=Okeania sp. SIO2B3 TaxID=2607784 RepID=UPI0013BFAD39|nr:hypothetical protein [Okeania sp. SIO2B3]NET45320.1 hypothetical protein [Okeania sp. SIO2B3]
MIFFSNSVSCLQYSCLLTPSSVATFCGAECGLQGFGDDDVVYQSEKRCKIEKL